MDFIAQRASRFFQDVLPEELCDILHRRNAGARPTSRADGCRSACLRLIWRRIMRLQLLQRLREQGKLLVDGENARRGLALFVRGLDDDTLDAAVHLSSKRFEPLCAQFRAALDRLEPETPPGEIANRLAGVDIKPRLEPSVDELVQRAILLQEIRAKLAACPHHPPAVIRQVEALREFVTRMQARITPAPDLDAMGQLATVAADDLAELHFLVTRYRDDPALPRLAAALSERALPAFLESAEFLAFKAKQTRRSWPDADDVDLAELADRLEDLAGSPTRPEWRLACLESLSTLSAKERADLEWLLTKFGDSEVAVLLTLGLTHAPDAELHQFFDATGKRAHDRLAEVAAPGESPIVENFRKKFQELKASPEWKPETPEPHNAQMVKKDDPHLAVETAMGIFSDSSLTLAHVEALAARFMCYSCDELRDFILEFLAQPDADRLHWIRMRTLTPEEVRDYSLSLNLVGLALSGGGIRSATFGLGGLQFLAAESLLPMLDYQSSVSGGGYISSWLAAWIKREQPVAATGPLARRSVIANVSEQLQPNRREQARAVRQHEITSEDVVDGEPYPIYHLRAYSNYLAPRLGIFSADGWTMVSICLRNLLLNQAAFLFVAFSIWLGIAGVVRLYVLAAELPGQLDARFDAAAALLFFIGGVILTLIFLRSANQGIDAMLPPDDDDLRAQAPVKPAQEKKDLWLRILAPLGLAALFLSLTAAFCKGSVSPAWFYSALLGVCLVLGTAVGVLFTLKAWRATGDNSARIRQRWSTICGPFGGILLFVVLTILFAIADPTSPAAHVAPARATFFLPVYIVFAVPGLLLVFVLACYLFIGVLRERLSPARSEWWGSLTAWILMLAALWLSIAGLVVFGTWLFVPEWEASRAKITAGVSWLVTTLSGLYAAQSSKSGDQRQPNTWSDLLTNGLALLAPTVFLVGYGLALSVLAYWALFETCTWLSGSALAFTHATYWLAFRVQFDGTARGILLLAAEPIVFLGAGWLLFWITRHWIGQIVDVNLFSLESLYGNRLVRCYLGASRPPQDGFDSPVHPAPTNSNDLPRNPVALTGFDARDDIVLSHFTPQARDERGMQAYTGPVLIINAALNWASGRELAWQERKAESFVFTARYCGSATTNYRTTQQYGGPARVTLGKAVSVSGAAVAPNMGYHSSPAVTALLTLFNVRLGAWLGNPKKDTWRERGPRAGVVTLLYEAMSRTDAEDEYIYLSDGGHFDNLGIYELVRRRCRLIIAYDGGADGNFAFDDLAMMIRKVRIDFGVRIVIDVEPLRPKGPNRLSSRHVAVGKIYYKDVDAPVDAPPDSDESYVWSPRGNPLEGVLIYIKPALTGDEPIDVQNYRTDHADFPHQTTLDQFFTESQFESYRALGYHSFSESLQPALARFQRECGAPELFKEIFAHWCSMPPEFSDPFQKANGAYVAIQQQLGGRAELAKLAEELQNPNANAAWQGRNADEERAERAMVAQMLTLIENTYFGLELDDYLDHPKNAGWKQTFRAWVETPTFRHWHESLLGEFSIPVRHFVREKLIGHG